MRADSSTSRYFGETEELLPKYAWCQLNALGHTWPVGSLKPNDLGLFDVQGNASTWCQKISQDYPPTKAGEFSDDREDESAITGTTGLVVRGASFASHPSNLRSAYRSNRVPAIKNDSYGFRLARTFAR